MSKIKKCSTPRKKKSCGHSAAEHLGAGERRCAHTADRHWYIYIYIYKRDIYKANTLARESDDPHIPHCLFFVFFVFLVLLEIWKRSASQHWGARSSWLLSFIIK
jgi:hypothetical protein